MWPTRSATWPLCEKRRSWDANSQSELSTLAEDFLETSDCRERHDRLQPLPLGHCVTLTPSSRPARRIFSSLPPCCRRRTLESLHAQAMLAGCGAIIDNCHALFRAAQVAGCTVGRSCRAVGGSRTHGAR